jgi:hypothetical protein
MRYFADAHQIAVASPDSPQGLVMVYPAPTGGGSIGKAYYCGQDAAGDPAWSLKIHGRWLEGRWLLIGHEFVPAQGDGRQPRG